MYFECQKSNHTFNTPKFNSTFTDVSIEVAKDNNQYDPVHISHPSGKHTTKNIDTENLHLWVSLMKTFKQKTL